MKMRVTVDGQAYQVEVEVLDTLPSAASRVEGAPAGKPPPRGSQRRGPITNGTSPAPAAPASAPASAPLSAPAAAPAAPPGVGAAPIVPWHGLSVGSTPGEVIAPVPGIVTAVNTKPGARVKQHDALLTIEVSRTYSPGEKPLKGTVRAVATGVVRELLVQKGDAVHAGHVLARIDA